MSDDSFIKSLDCIGALAKWFTIFPYTAFVELRIWDRDNDIDVHIYSLSCSILDVHTKKKRE